MHVYVMQQRNMLWLLVLPNIRFSFVREYLTACTISHYKKNRENPNCQKVGNVR